MTTSKLFIMNYSLSFKRDLEGIYCISSAPYLPMLPSVNPIAPKSPCQTYKQIPAALGLFLLKTLFEAFDNYNCSDMDDSPSCQRTTV